MTAFGTATSGCHTPVEWYTSPWGVARVLVLRDNRCEVAGSLRVPAVFEGMLLFCVARRDLWQCERLVLI
jgi:hypothetical protein